jgi:hypothetical protein
MTGDQADMLARLRSVLPARWFPDVAPVLDGVLSGIACAWSWSYGQLAYVKQQTRIATATDTWLDIIAQDFFGSRLARKGRTDPAFRARIQLELLRERGTRAAVISILQDLTGRPPRVFEPGRVSDTGGYGSRANPATGLAYGFAGGWGNSALPFQCFITVFRPSGAGITNVAGWGSSGGGYSVGAIEYGNLAMMQVQVTDADVYAAIADVMPVATIGWTQISN